MTHTLLPVLIMMLIAVVVGIVMLALAWFVGGHARTASKQEPYESGVPALDENRKRVNVRFYQIAMLFILFDIEAAFLYPWALVLRRGGWALFAAVMVFVFLILVGYAYIWLKGGLDLGPMRELRRRPGGLSFAGRPAPARRREAQV